MLDSILNPKTHVPYQRRAMKHFRCTTRVNLLFGDTDLFLKGRTVPGPERGRSQPASSATHGPICMCSTTLTSVQTSASPLASTRSRAPPGGRGVCPADLLYLIPSLDLLHGCVLEVSADRHAFRMSVEYLGVVCGILALAAVVMPPSASITSVTAIRTALVRTRLP